MELHRSPDDLAPGHVSPAAPRDVAFLAKAIEAAGLGVLALERRTGRVLQVNAAGAATFRAAAGPASDDPLEALARAALAEASTTPSGGGEAARELALGDRVVGFTTYPTDDTLWVLFRDVTERVRATTVSESLQLSDALLSVFTALRHDLGNSVNAAKTSLYVLRQGLGRHDEAAVRRYVDRALEALAPAEKVLGTLRDYGFAARPCLRPLPVGELLEGASLECGSRLAAIGTSLDLELEEPGAQVLADPASLEEVICDVVHRAELSARGGADPRVVVRAEVRRDTVAIRVSPRDGRGRPPRPPADDADLRLLVVRRLVSQMDGTFEVDEGDAIVTLTRPKGPE
jgi:hypothetical protein